MEKSHNKKNNLPHQQNWITSKHIIENIQSFFNEKINHIISMTDGIVVSKYGKHIPAVIFATSLAISTQLWRIENNSISYEISKQLDSQLLDITYPIQSRINSYEQILYWIHGFFDASEKVTREEFTSYLDSLKLETNFPEIPWVSVSKYVKWSEINHHISSIKTEWFPLYGKNIILWKEEYAPVIYIEPFKWHNINVFWFDNFSDVTRKELLKNAQILYKPMISHSLSLKQDEKAGTNNFLMTFPIYEKKFPHINDAEHQENIFWWWSLVFNMDDLINKIYPNKLSNIAIKIYADWVEDEDFLIYSSFHWNTFDSNFHIKRSKTIPVLNKKWTFVIYSSVLQEKTTHHEWYLNNIVYSGIFVTFLLTFFSYWFIKMRLDALLLVKQQQKSIKDLKNMAEDMKHLAIHDSLTKLPNRVWFLEKLNGLISLANRNDSKVAFMFIDLDKFKYVNDNYWHHIWDKLLVAVTLRIDNILRWEDIIGRQWWDEFFVAIWNFKDIEIASRVATKIIEVLKTPFIIENHEIHIWSSIWISIYPDDSKDITDLQKYADLAMYSVKSLGRNGYHFYTQSMQKDSEEYNLIATALRNAIEKKEFSMVYQPIVDISTWSISSMEALIRWNNPELWTISPAKFIPIAENDVHNIESIGNRTIWCICDQILQWKKEWLYVPRIAVNLSAKQFLKKSFQDDIMLILKEKNISPKEIWLEITEWSLFKDINNAVKTVNNLSQLWFTILIDDFGTGYSNLHYISKFSAWILKIDVSFVSTIETDEDKQIVILIIALAHSLWMSTVAEWVETKKQYDILETLGCDFIQWYYCYRPEKPEEIMKKLSSIV